MIAAARPARRRGPQGLEPLSPRRKWQAITLATLVLVPAFWAILAGVVATTPGTKGSGPNPAAAIAFGLALIPFAFTVLAFVSEHPRAPGAVVKAMSLAVLVGVPISALAGDAVSGMVAGVGAGAVSALRADDVHSWRARVIAVAFATVYTFVLIRMVGALALLFAPIFPITGIGIADHLTERRQERAATRT